MSIGDNIRKAREMKNMTQLELAQKLGYKNRTSITKIEAGNNDLPQSKVIKFARALGVSELQIMGLEPMPKLIPIRIPVLGSIPAGVPIEAIENILDWEELDPREYNPTHQYFGLMVKGDSMYPRYLEGDIVICQAADDVESGKDVVAYVNGYDATLKTLYKREDGSVELRAVNVNHPPRVYKSDPVCILGFVRELRRKM